MPQDTSLIQWPPSALLATISAQRAQAPPMVAAPDVCLQPLSVMGVAPALATSIRLVAPALLATTTAMAALRLETLPALPVRTASTVWTALLSPALTPALPLSTSLLPPASVSLSSNRMPCELCWLLWSGLLFLFLLRHWNLSCGRNERMCTRLLRLRSQLLLRRGCVL